MRRAHRRRIIKFREGRLDPKIYRTGLISIDVPEDVKIAWYKPRRWQLLFREERYVGEAFTGSYRTRKPTASFTQWERKIAKRYREAYNQSPVITLTKTGAFAGCEIFIRAKNRSVAQRAMDLITLSSALLDPESFCVGVERDRSIYPADEGEREPQDRDLPKFHTMGGGLTLAALTAARLSQRRSWQSAAWRYFYSCINITVAGKKRIPIVAVTGP